MQMKMIGSSLPLLLLVLTVFTTTIILTPPSSSAVEVGIGDIFHLMKSSAIVILKAWDIVQELPDVSNLVKYPLLSHGQREVLHSLRTVSDQILQTEQAVRIFLSHSFQVLKIFFTFFIYFSSRSILM